MIQCKLKWNNSCVILLYFNFIPTRLSTEQSILNTIIDMRNLFSILQQTMPNGIIRNIYKSDLSRGHKKTDSAMAESGNVCDYQLSASYHLVNNKGLIIILSLKWAVWHEGFIRIEPRLSMSDSTNVCVSFREPPTFKWFSLIYVSLYRLPALSKTHQSQLSLFLQLNWGCRKWAPLNMLKTEKPLLIFWPWLD